MRSGTGAAPASIRVSDGRMPAPALHLTADIHRYADAYLEMEARASDPYDSFVYRDRPQADSLRRRLFDQDAGEFTASHGRLLIEDEVPVGMMACLTTIDLQRSKLRAARTLHAELLTDQALATRIRLAGQTTHAS